MDGKEHRVAIEGDTGKKKSAMYTGFTDGRANGRLTNFRVSNEPVNWVHTGQEITAEDKVFIAAQTKENRERTEIQRAESQVKAGKQAFGIYANAERSDATHEYLQSKDIRHSEMLTDIKVSKSGDLIVPVRTMDGKITSAQYIKPDGSKFFHKGGAIRGGSHTVGDFATVRKGTADKILVAEGFATASTLHEATKLPVVVAFNSGNLKPVAEAVREVNPKATIIIAGDNDLKSEHNVGRDKAFEAAQAVNGKVILPLFTEAEVKEGRSDWNDLKASRGDVSATIKAAVSNVAPSRSREQAGMEMG